MSTWTSNYLPMIPAFLVAAGFLALLLTAVQRLRKSERRLPAGRLALIWVMVCWLAGVLMITVVSSLGTGNPAAPDSQVDLIPFRTLLNEGAGLGGIAVIERLANIAMFLVGGVVTSVALGWGVARTTVSFLILGAAIETIQFVVPGSRAVTTDDVLWAVIGGATGAWLALPMRSAGWHRKLFTREPHVAT